MVGAVLAVALILAATISVDVAEENAFLFAVNDTPIDLLVWAPGFEERFMEGIGSVPGLEYAVPVASLRHFFQVHLYKGSTMGFSKILGIDPGLETIATQIGITYTGSFNLGPGDVLLVRHAVRAITDHRDTSLAPGSNITLRFDGLDEPGLNLTYVGSFDIDWSRCYQSLGHSNPPEVIVSLETGIRLIDELGPGSGFAEFVVGGSRWNVPETMLLYLVGLERSTFLDPSSLEETLGNLEEAASRIGEATGLETEYFAPLEATEESYRDAASQRMNTYLLAALPILLLGIYLGMVGMDLSNMERRREVGLLRCRGFTDGQITRIQVAEAALLGCVAGILGAGLAVLIASGLPTPGFGDLTGTVLPKASVILTGAGIAAGMMLLALIGSLRRIRKMDAVELLSGYSPQLSRGIYRPRRDLALVLVPLAIYGIVNLAPALSSLRPGYLASGIVDALLAASIIVLPFAPIMMSVGLTRLLTRGITKTYNALTIPLGPLLGDLKALVERDVERHANRTSSVAMLLALSIALGSFVVVLPATDDLNGRRRDTFVTGSDIIVDLGESYNPSILDEVSSLEGVEVASMIEVLSEGYRSFILLEPQSYRATIRNNPFYTQRSDEAINAITEDPGLAVAQRAVLRDSDSPPGYVVIGIGDDLAQFRVSSRVSFINLPGARTTLYERAEHDKFLIHIDHRDPVWEAAQTGSNPRRRGSILVRVMPGEDGGEVAERLEAALKASSVRQATPTPMRGLYSSGYLLSFVRVEFGLAMLMASVGVGVVIWVGLRERRQEIAQMKARGLARGQIARILTGETILMGLLGLLIGLLGGLLPPYLYVVTTTREQGLTIPTALAVPWYLVVLPLLIFAAISLIPLFVAMRPDSAGVQQALKERA